MPLPLLAAAILNVARTALTYVVEKFTAYLVRRTINAVIGKIVTSLNKAADLLTFDNFSDKIGEEVEEDDEMLDILEEDEEFQFTEEELPEIEDDEHPQPFESFQSILPETVEDLDNLGLEIEEPESDFQQPDFQFNEDE